MAKYDLILKYQELDKKRNIVLQEIEQSSQKNNLENSFKELKTIHLKLDESQKESDAIVAEINAIKEETTKYLKRIDELNERIKDLEDEEKIKIYPELESIKNKMEKADKKLLFNNAKLKEIVLQGRLLLSSRIKAKEYYDKCKNQFEKYRALCQPKINEIDNDMKLLEGEIETAALDLYKAHRKDVKLPLLVEVIGEIKPNIEESSLSCLCGMSLSRTSITELKTRTFCQCESCHRYVILNKK